MIRGMIGYELRGEVDLRFPTTGVECDLSVPLGRPEGGVVTHTGHRTAAAGHR
jgi:hypothetical protein